MNQVIKAINLGNNLLSKKNQLEHGDFSQYIIDSVEFSHRTANRYIRLFKKRHLLESVSSLATAYKIINNENGESRHSKDIVSKIDRDNIVVVAKVDRDNNKTVSKVVTAIKANEKTSNDLLQNWTQLTDKYNDIKKRIQNQKKNIQYCEKGSQGISNFLNNVMW